ncbi:hypothetical protein P2318_31750 [Myxococcaceae bacterium GXIMD 01537]
MIDVVLRVSGEEFDVEGFLERFPEVKPSATWRKGQRRFRTRPPSEDSGFNLPVGEGGSWDASWRSTQRTLEPLREVVKAAVASGAAASLDIGCLVGAPDAYAPQVSLELADMEFLVKLGVSVVLTAYPVDAAKESVPSS